MQIQLFNLPRAVSFDFHGTRDRRYLATTVVLLWPLFDGEKSKYDVGGGRSIP